MDRPILDSVDKENLPSEDDLPDNWIEEKHDALKEVLEEMTVIYNEDNEPVEVMFKSHSYADASGDYIAINPNLHETFDVEVSGPNILRLLDEINSHEMGHYNWSQLDGKHEFSKLYPGWGKIPGAIANIIEDEYVDAKKMREFYGLRRKRAYRAHLMLKTESCTPDVAELCEEHGLPNALIAALHQVAIFGTARGIADAPTEVQEFAALVEPVIKRARRQNDFDERVKLYHVVMQLLRRYVDDPEEFDDEHYSETTGSMVSGSSESAPDMDAIEDYVLKEFMEEAVKEMMEEMMESGEFPFDDVEDSGDGSLIIEVEMGAAASPDGGDDELESAAEEAEMMSEEDAAAGSVEGESVDGESESDDGSERRSDSSDDVHRDVDKPEEMDPSAPPPTADIEGGEAIHHVDEEFLSALADRDLSDGVEERYEVNLDDIDKADNRDRMRWVQLVRRLQEYDLDVEVRKRERDERIQYRQKKYESRGRTGRLGSGLKKRAERKGVIRELEEGFRKLVSRRVPQPDTRGNRIDSINVARRAAGDLTMTELFEEEQMVETGDRCVGLATDISGSMGSAIDELKIAGGVIAEATQIIGDEFVWEAFTDKPHRDGLDALDLRIVTAPNEQFSWDHVDSFASARNEPTAAGVRDCFKLMKQTDANQYVMIVITDGIALVTEDGKRPGDNTPVEQARKAVDEVRSHGVDVIGLGIGGMDDAKMEETFGGNNYKLTTIDDLARDILDLYREQLDTVRYA